MNIVKLTQEELRAARPSLEELKLKQRLPVTAVLENIRSLYNVGSMFRTADGACAEKLYLSGYTGCPPRKEIDKTALGSTEAVPWERIPNTYEVIYSLRRKGYRIVCLEQTAGSIPYNQADYSFPMCLVVGNEVDGVSAGLVSECDAAIDIPMSGLKQSLNVAVAFGIALYHITGEFQKAIRNTEFRIPEVP